MLNIKQNIGILNALIRITAGLTILSWCTAKLVKKPWRDSYIFLAFMGAMKVAEGIVRYCPVTDLFQQSQTNQPGDDDRSTGKEDKSEEQARPSGRRETIRY